MGLPLYNPVGSILYLSELEPEPEESGILSRRLGGPTPSSKHHRPFHHVPRSSLDATQLLGGYHQSLLKPDPAPSHFDRSHNWPSYSLPKTPRSLDDLDVETREGRDLARSSAVQPRRPSLEREEAFCGERPRKKRCLSQEEDADAGDETVQELYRLGLLYDNPHERGERFTFDAIAHDEPLYSINVQQSKRRRKRQAADRQGTPDSWHYALPLDLSFATHEDDARLAALLMAPDHDEVASPTELNRGTAALAVRRWPEEREMAGPTPCMWVVYGVEEENVGGEGARGHATTQTTQSLPASQDYPELVSDSEHEDADAEGVEWEVLDDSESSSEGGVTGPEAWVVLG